MKRLVLPMAFVAATLSAFAFKEDAFALFRASTGPDLCVPETVCTIANKTNCDVQIYSAESPANGPCLTPVTYGKP